MPMTRKQIYLDADSERGIRRLARATKLSEAEHVRRAIALYITVKSVRDARRVDHPLIEMIGICEGPTGPTDAAARHDAYLYGRRP